MFFFLCMSCFMQILPHIIWVFTQIYIQMENSDSWYNDSLNPFFSYSSHLKYEAFGPSSVSFLSLGFRGLFIHLQHTIGCLQALLLTTNSICYLWTPSFVWHCEKEKLNHLVFSSYIHVSQKEGFSPQVMGYRNYQDAFSQMRWHQSSASMSFFSQFFGWVWKVSTLPLRTGKKSSLICCRYEISR